MYILRGFMPLVNGVKSYSVFNNANWRKIVQSVDCISHIILITILFHYLVTLKTELIK